MGTYEEVVAALALAGWPTGQWATAAAIVNAESSRNLTAQNASGAYGWMQILKSAHPTLFQGFPDDDPFWWAEPITACTMGLKVWQGQGGSFEPWTTYNSGAYRLYLTAASQAVTEVQAAAAKAATLKDGYTAILKPLESQVAGILELGALAGTLGDLQSTLNGVAAGTGQAVVSTGATVASTLSWTGLLEGFLGDLTKTGTWVSVAYIVGGVVLLLVVLVQALKSSSAVQSAAAIATKAVI